MLCQDLPVPAARPPRPARRPLRRHLRAGRACRSAPSSVARALSPTRTTCSGGTGSSLCGPGGVGKTRLALRGGGRGEPLRRRRRAGRVRRGGPDDVEAVLAAALRMADAGTAAAPGGFADRVVALLAVRRQLLVFDNCEHVLDEAAGLVEAICAGTDGVDLLVTSREPLGVDGERVVGVEPLNPADAATLLTERMRAADPDRTAPAASPPTRRRGLPRLDGLRWRWSWPRPRRLARALRSPPRARRAVPGPARRPSHGDGAAPVAARRRRVVLRPARRRAAGAVRAAVGVRRPRRVRGGRGRLRRRRGPAGPGGPLTRRAASRRPATFGMLETLRPSAGHASPWIRPPSACGPARPGLPARREVSAAAVAPVNSPHRGGSTSTAPTCGGPTPGCVSTGRWTSCSGSPCPSPSWASCVDAPTSSCCWRTLRVAGVLGRDRCTPALPLVARLLGYHAHTLWQRGDLDAGERQARRALDVAAAVGEPSAGRDAEEALANVLVPRRPRAARRHGVLALELATRPPILMPWRSPCRPRPPGRLRG